MALTGRERRNIGLGLAFLAPNIIGFMVFALVPLVFSLVMAFTNWDLKLHNMFKEASIGFVGVDNFTRLVGQKDFWRYLGNTLFFMMGIPFSVAGSLILAILLTRDLRGGNKRVFLCLTVGAVFVASILLLVAIGSGQSAMFILLTSVACGILVFGIVGGTTFYRTMFYLPHFCAGVATFILWKKLYSPFDGPINAILETPLNGLAVAVQSTGFVKVQLGMALCYGLVAIVLLYSLRRLIAMWRDGELGWSAAVVPVILLTLAPALALLWSPWIGARPEETADGPSFWTLTNNRAGWALALVAVAILGWGLYQVVKGRDYKCVPSNGVGTALMFAAAMMVVEFVLLGFGIVFFNLPTMATDGFRPPEWISNYHWAKPALMIMGLWGAIGSNNMLLYIAGLSNVPQDLYEAADIDGASGFQRFWSVTWPQLAPTTFFIAVMATIHGLRGGFEIARTMTLGGPAGSTTFLSYFIFTEGFETGRLGYSSAVAWTLFTMTFALTIFNWKFGNRYVND